MNFKDAKALIGDLQEREPGKLFDSKGRFRASFDSKNGTITFVSRYVLDSKIENDIAQYFILDRETNEEIAKSTFKYTSAMALEMNYPAFQDPMAYWS